MRGYCCLIFRRHVVELHDLEATEAAAYMRDIQRVSNALKSVTEAVQVNYEIHGNIIPHMHTHFFPLRTRPAMRIAVLASGEGTTLQSIIDAINSHLVI